MERGEEKAWEGKVKEIKRELRSKAVGDLKRLLLFMAKGKDLNSRWAGSWAQCVVDFSDSIPKVYPLEVYPLGKDQGARVEMKVGNQSISIRMGVNFFSVRSAVLESKRKGAQERSVAAFYLYHNEPMLVAQHRVGIEKETLWLKSGDQEKDFTVAIEKTVEGINISAGQRKFLIIH